MILAFFSFFKEIKVKELNDYCFLFFCSDNKISSFVLSNVVVL